MSLHQTREPHSCVAGSIWMNREGFPITARAELDLVLLWGMSTAFIAASHKMASSACGVTFPGTNSLSILLVSHGHKSFSGLKIAKRSIGDKVFRFVLGSSFPGFAVDGMVVPCLATVYSNVATWGLLRSIMIPGASPPIRFSKSASSVLQTSKSKE